MRRTARLTVSALLLAVTAGCDSPEPVPWDGDDDALYGLQCAEEVTILAGLDADSAMPFTGAELLELAEGERSSAMVWGAGLDDPFAKVTFGPESGEAKLAVEISYGGGEVRYVKSTLEGQGDGFADECHDRLEVDVDVHLSSSGGAFDETFSAPLAATIARIGTIRHTLALDAVGGSLAVEALEPADAAISPIELELGITADGLFGGASSVVEIQEGDFVGATFMSYARWPGAEQSCEFGQAPLEIASPAAGFSGEDALKRISDAGPLEISWGGGETSSLEIELESLGKACASTTDGSIQLETTAAVISGDGRWKGSLPMRVLAEAADDGTLGVARLEIEAPYATQIDAAAFAEHYGLGGVDLTGFDAGILSFGATFEPDGESIAVEGFFEVLGVESHDCAPDANGCSGDEYTSLEVGSWGAL